MCLFLKHKYLKVKHVSVSCFYSVFQTLDMTESHGSNFKICKLANFPKVDFCRIIVGAIWDPCNELKKKPSSQLDNCCCYYKCPGSPTIVSFFTGLQWTVGRGCTIPSHYIEVRHDTDEAYCIALSRCTHYSKLFSIDNMSNLRPINAHSNNPTYRRRLARGRRTQLWAHVCRRQSR